MYKDYNMNQVVLPLDLEIKLKKDDVAFPINELFPKYVHIPYNTRLYTYLNQP